jgi:hypothetical protein
MERGKVHTGVWWGSLEDENHLENLVVDERV